MDLKNKKILITGVAGMIGSHLLDMLMEYDEPGGIYGIDDLSVGKLDNIKQWTDSGKFTFFKGDILDNNFLDTLPEVDVIVHLASSKKIGELNPGVQNLKINGIGSQNIFSLALKFNAKIIFGSTSDSYGMSPNLPFREDGNLLLGPSTLKRWGYAVSKVYAEQLAFAYYKDHKLRIVVLRYFGGFSERASFTWTSGHIPLFIDAILKDEKCIIHGDGRQTRSMSYVSNLVYGTYLAIKEDRAVGELINIGDEREMSVLESAELIHKIADTGKKLKLEFIKTEQIYGKYEDIQRRRPDLTKAKKILNYKERVSLEEGIAKVICARKKALGID